MTTRVYLVRHGATTLAAEDRFAGETDVPLSDEGREQARRLGLRLAGAPLGAVYASPLRRTVETARAVVEPHGLDVVTVPELREISHGHWETRTRDEVAERFPGEYAQWQADPFSYAPPGGETGLAVTARALPALAGIVERHPGETVLVVSHKATIRLLLSTLLGFDPRSYRDRLDQSPACLNILDFRDRTHARLTLFNDTSHWSPGPAETPAVPSGRLSPWWGGGPA